MMTTHARMPDAKGPSERALQFLLEMQRADGLWADFHTLAGQSNEWMSGVVMNSLARMSSDSCGGPVERAARALVRRQRHNGGWAYNDKVPADCDSTAAILQALPLCHATKPSALVRAARYLLRHQDAQSGGFSTYAPSDRIEQFIDALPEQTRGWTSPHFSVTCNSVLALHAVGAGVDSPRLSRAVRGIANRREPHGLWTCYWWHGQGYPTCLALRTLNLANALDPETAGDVARAIVERQQADGTWRVGNCLSPFETALMLRALSQVVHLASVGRASMRRAADALLALQKQDGSFDGTPILRIPPAPVTDANEVPAWRVDEAGTGVLVSDSERVFTTASIIPALSTLQCP